MDKIIMLGIVGSLRRESYNRSALQAAQELVPTRTFIQNLLAALAQMASGRLAGTRHPPHSQDVTVPMG